MWSQEKRAPIAMEPKGFINSNVMNVKAKELLSDPFCKRKYALFKHFKFLF